MAKAVVNAMLVTSLLVLAGGCGSDPVEPRDVAKSTKPPGTSPPSDDVVVGELLPSQTARRQAAAIELLREAGWTVETNGFEEAVVASLEDGRVGAENGAKLAGLETLEQVRLWNCRDVDDSLVGRLADLPKLRVLAVRGGQLTDGCFESLAGTATLESLNVGDTPGLTGRGLERLLTSGRFKRLYLDRTGVTDEVVSGWPVENALEMLNVNHTGLGPAAAGSLSGFETLRSAFVAGTKISLEAVAKWRTARPSCLVYDGRERPGGVEKADSKATRPPPENR